MLEALGRVLPASSSSWGRQVSLACGLIPPVSTSIFTQLSSLCVSLFSYKDTTDHWTSDPTLIQVDFISGSLTTCIFPNKVTFQGSGWT